MNIESTITLNNGVEMPRLGFGVFKAAGDTYDAVRVALETGYRHIDTAAIYKNEEDTGRAIKDSGVPREKVFVTTKAWTVDMREGRVYEACKESLTRLGLSYVDLYLLHWAIADQSQNQAAYADMERLLKEGYVRAIGTSNHSKRQLDAIIPKCTVLPAASQIEIHPYLSNADEVSFLKSMNIAPVAWSPLGRGRIVQDETLAQIGKAYGKTAAQVALRWNLQRGVLVIPKSVTPQRIVENANLFDFSLTQEEMLQIDGINQNLRTGSNPETYPY